MSIIILNICFNFMVIYQSRK